MKDLTSTQGYSDLTDGREMISCTQEEVPEQFPVFVDLSLTGMVREVEDNTISPVVGTESLCHVGRIDLMHDGSSETLQLFDRLDSPVSLFQHVKGIECGGEEVERGECLLECEGVGEVAVSHNDDCPCHKLSALSREAKVSSPALLHLEFGERRTRSQESHLRGGGRDKGIERKGGHRGGGGERGGGERGRRAQ